MYHTLVNIRKLSCWTPCAYQALCPSLWGIWTVLLLSCWPMIKPIQPIPIVRQTWPKKRLDFDSEWTDDSHRNFCLFIRQEMQLHGLAFCRSYGTESLSCSPQNKRIAGKILIPPQVARENSSSDGRRTKKASFFLILGRDRDRDDHTRRSWRISPFPFFKKRKKSGKKQRRQGGKK